MLLQHTKPKSGDPWSAADLRKCATQLFAHAVPPMPLLVSTPAGSVPICSFCTAHMAQLFALPAQIFFSVWAREQCRPSPARQAMRKATAKKAFVKTAHAICCVDSVHKGVLHELALPVHAHRPTKTSCCASLSVLGNRSRHDDSPQRWRTQGSPYGPSISYYQLRSNAEPAFHCCSKRKHPRHLLGPDQRTLIMVVSALQACGKP